MACMKSIVFSALVVIVAASVVEAHPCSCLKSDVHNIYECPDPSLAQKKIFDTTIHERRRFLGFVKKSIQFPSNGKINQDEITCIQVINLVQDGTGGYPTIFDDSIGQYEITINLESQRSRGLDFRVILWTGTATTPQPCTSEATTTGTSPKH